MSHVMPEPEPALRYGHANYGPERVRPGGQAGEFISAWDHHHAAL